MGGMAAKGVALSTGCCPYRTVSKLQAKRQVCSPVLWLEVYALQLSDCMRRASSSIRMFSKLEDMNDGLGAMRSASCLSTSLKLGEHSDTPFDECAMWEQALQVLRSCSKLGQDLTCRSEQLELWWTPDWQSCDVPSRKNTWTDGPIRRSYSRCKERALAYSGIMSVPRQCEQSFARMREMTLRRTRR